MNALSLWKGETLVSLVPTMREITKIVAQAHGCSFEELVGQSRDRVIAWPRQEAMWACRQVRRDDGSRRYSLPTIGRFFGRDHTTVLHACRQFEKRQKALEEASAEGVRAQVAQEFREAS